MSWIKALFMCWGMFLSLPCPYRKWDDEARDKMTAVFPFVGIIVGIVWAIVAFVFSLLIEINITLVAVRAMALTITPWILTGFMHLDGFMDVCDAVLSRRDLQTRQKILKDSHCGAFAVISLVILAIIQFSFALCSTNISLIPLLLVPVAVRASAAIAVTNLRPMASSQYSSMKKKGNYLALELLVILAALAISVIAGIFGFGGTRLIAAFAPVLATAIYWLGVCYGYRQLDGMNGDISGFSLVIAECAGLALVCLG